MPPLAIDRTRFQTALSLHADGSRPRRFATDQSKRHWYASERSKRYARYLELLATLPHAERNAV